MLSTATKRSLAALAAVVGLLAIAGPASAQTNGFVVDGPFTLKGSVGACDVDVRLHPVLRRRRHRASPRRRSARAGRAHRDLSARDAARAGEHARVPASPWPTPRCA